MLDVTLDIHLRLLAVRRGGQRDDAKYARAHTLCDRLDGTALSGAVMSFEHNDDPQVFELDSILKVAKLRLQPPQFLFILLTFKLGLHLAALHFCHRHHLRDYGSVSLQTLQSPGFYNRHHPSTLIARAIGIGDNQF